MPFRDPVGLLADWREDRIRNRAVAVGAFVGIITFVIRMFLLIDDTMGNPLLLFLVHMVNAFVGVLLMGILNAGNSVTFDEYIATHVASPTALAAARAVITTLCVIALGVLAMNSLALIRQETQVWLYLEVVSFAGLVLAILGYLYTNVLEWYCLRGGSGGARAAATLPGSPLSFSQRDNEMTAVYSPVGCALPMGGVGAGTDAGADGDPLHSATGLTGERGAAASGSTPTPATPWQAAAVWHRACEITKDVAGGVRRVERAAAAASPSPRADATRGLGDESDARPWASPSPGRVRGGGGLAAPPPPATFLEGTRRFFYPPLGWGGADGDVAPRVPATLGAVKFPSRLLTAVFLGLLWTFVAINVNLAFVNALERGRAKLARGSTRLRTSERAGRIADRVVGDATMVWISPPPPLPPTYITAGPHTPAEATADGGRAEVVPGVASPSRGSAELQRGGLIGRLTRAPALAPTAAPRSDANTTGPEEDDEEEEEEADVEDVREFLDSFRTLLEGFELGIHVGSAVGAVFAVCSAGLTLRAYKAKLIEFRLGVAHELARPADYAHWRSATVIGVTASYIVTGALFVCYELAFIIMLLSYAGFWDTLSEYREYLVSYAAYFVVYLIFQWCALASFICDPATGQVRPGCHGTFSWLILFCDFLYLPFSFFAGLYRILYFIAFVPLSYARPDLSPYPTALAMYDSGHVVFAATARLMSDCERDRVGGDAADAATAAAVLSDGGATSEAAAAATTATGVDAPLLERPLSRATASSAATPAMSWMTPPQREGL